MAEFDIIFGSGFLLWVVLLTWQKKLGLLSARVPGATTVIISPKVGITRLSTWKKNLKWHEKLSSACVRSWKWELLSLPTP